MRSHDLNRCAPSEKFAATVNKLKSRVTMVFIAHQLPRTLLVDSVVRIDAVGAQI